MKKQLNKSEIKEINRQLQEQYGLEEFFSKKDTLEIVDKKFIVKEGKLCFFQEGELLIPSLKLILESNFLPIITVDMGAIKFVTNGADVMRPGITRIADGVRKDAPTVIIDETHSKPLAIGIALFDAEDMRKQDGGKSVRSLHHVGDELWSF